MTKIQDLFVYPIKRNITTVIKMDDLRPQEMKQELEEYIVTDTIEELLIEFLERYGETRTEQTDRIGVWIAGFFGSGKSHFAKILSYLLENKVVDNQAAIDYFKLRIVNTPRRSEIERLLHQVTNFIDTTPIAFQIKTEEELMVGETTGDSDWLQAHHISTIMYRQWLKKRGFSTTLWVGRLEQQLSNLGYYDAFTTKVRELEGKNWTEVREHEIEVRDAAVSAMHAILPDRYPSKERASKAIDDLQADLRMGPSILAEELVKWLDTQQQPGSEKTPHLVYIIDEMGQFIGGNSQKLLELQSIAEAFASKGLGKLWLIVTAQEALEEIVRDVLRHEDEFSKIRDRFNMRLHLTSENIETVLEERILKKKESRLPEVETLYRQAGGNIATVCTLQNTSALPQPDAKRFVANYPFPPYQLAVMQQIFVAVRTPGGDKEKIEGTERSLIGVTQAVLKSPATGFAESSVGRLVAFDEIYDQVEHELPSADRRTINEVRGSDSSFQKRVLKALYLIQKLEWVPTTTENLSRLLVNHVDDPQLPFSTLKQKTADGLVQLEQGYYVVEQGGQYEFLSGVKKDIEMEIASVTATVNDRRREIKKYLKTVLDIGRLNYQGIKRFDVVVRGDDDVISDRGEITLQVYSSIYTRATDLTQDEVVQRSIGDDRILYWYPAPSDELYRLLGKIIQTETIISQRTTRQGKSDEETAILREKQREVETMRGKIQTLLRTNLLDGAIIYDGEIRDQAGQTSQLNSIFTREISQIIPHVYTRFEPAAVKVDEKSIDQILTVKDNQLPSIEPELNLFDDACRLNRHAPVVSEMLEELRLRARAGDASDGKTLTDFFERVPYGWDPILVRIILAALFRSSVVSLHFEGRDYHDYKVSQAQELLTKTLSFRKTGFLYDPQEGLTPEERRKVQQAIDRIFGSRVPDTVNIMATTLEEHLRRLKQQNETQQVTVRENNLPVKSVLTEAVPTVEQILDQPQSDRKLKIFLQNAGPLKELKTYQDKLHDFIQAGRPAEYRRANTLKRAVAQAQSIAPDLAATDVQDWLAEMAAIEAHQEIVEKWGTFFQKMHPLLMRYQTAYENLHQQRYQTYQQIQAELEALNISADGLISRLCTGPISWTQDGLACTTCGTALDTLYYQIGSAADERARLIAAHHPNTGGDDGDDEPEFELLRLYDVIKTRDIKDANDLEAALGELRSAVEKALKAGKRVILS